MIDERYIEKVQGRWLAHIVKVDGKPYYIDTCEVSEGRYETMVFKKGGGGWEWSKPIYSSVYRNALQAVNEHQHTIRYLDDFIHKVHKQ